MNIEDLIETAKCCDVKSCADCPSWGRICCREKTMNELVNEVIRQQTEITSDFGAVCNCAVRYALGRRTYMPGIVCGFMRRIIRHLDRRTIACMERDIREARESGYGDACDEWIWMDLLGELQKLMSEHGIDRWQ